MLRWLFRAFQKQGARASREHAMRVHQGALASREHAMRVLVTLPLEAQIASRLLTKALLGAGPDDLMYPNAYKTDSPDDIAAIVLLKDSVLAAFRQTQGNPKWDLAMTDRKLGYLATNLLREYKEEIFDAAYWATEAIVRRRREKAGVWRG